MRTASGADLRDAGAPELTPTEILVVPAIAYLQPATRADLSRLAGREISRDVIGALKRHGLIDGNRRLSEPGAPFAYVTTRKVLEAFGLGTLRDLPDIERLEDKGLLEVKARGRAQRHYFSRERMILMQLITPASIWID